MRPLTSSFPRRRESKLLFSCSWCVSLLKKRVLCASVPLWFVCTFIFFFGSTAYGEVITLSQGLRIAAENNRLIKVTEREEGIAETDIFVARSALLPTVNTSLSQTFLAKQPEVKAFGTEPVRFQEKDYLSYSLNIQQLLYDFQGSVSRYRATKTVLDAKRFDTKRIRNLIALETTLVYFDLLESEKAIVVAEKEVERLDSHLRDARTLYENGVITKNDLLQAEVRLSDARQKLLSAKNLRAINTSRLNNLLARPLNTDMEVMDITDVPSDHMELDREKGWEAAVRQRPELLIVDETMKSLDFEETARKSEYYPAFFVRGSYDYVENRFQVHEGNLSLILGMNMNLFSGGSTKAEVLKIERQKMKLLEERNRLADEVRLEVERNILDMKTAKERVAVTRDAVQQAEENLRINKLRYSEGIGTATEVLDAVTLLTVAETNYHKSLYDLRRAEAAVEYSTGRDLLEVYR